MRILGEVEVFAWPLVPRGGQHVARNTMGVLALHKNTGIAVVCEDERSQYSNRRVALNRLADILDIVGLPNQWTTPATSDVESA